MNTKHLNYRSYTYYTDTATFDNCSVTTNYTKGTLTAWYSSTKSS